MPRDSSDAVIHYLRRLALGRSRPVLTDAQLLDQFVNDRDELAFEAIAHRHGPLVWGVCRRLLVDQQAAEDAFQATFLVLVRKASSLRRRELLGNWLYGVAYKIAHRSRSQSWRRQNMERSLQAALGQASERRECAEDIRPLLDEEIQRLPGKYREPFVLCYLEGKTNEQAAKTLGCPKGTVLSRLSRAREKLRDRLSRRGVQPAAIGLGLALVGMDAGAAVPSLMLESTIRSALLSAANGVVVQHLVSARVGALVKGTVQAMFLTKLRTTLVVVILAGLIGTSGELLQVGPSDRATAGPAEKEHQAQAGTAKDPGGDDESSGRALVAEERELIRVASPVSGILLFAGTDPRGVNVPKEERITFLDQGKARVFARLTVGQVVKAGEALARIDDHLAREDVKIAQAKLASAEADSIAAEKTREESKARWDTAMRLSKSGVNTITTEDLRGAKLTYDRYHSEAASKVQAVAVAKAELAKAELVVRQHSIHSPVDGVIREIAKRQGEGVKELETVFLIERTPSRLVVAPKDSALDPTNTGKAPGKGSSQAKTPADATVDNPFDAGKAPGKGSSQAKTPMDAMTNDVRIDRSKGLKGPSGVYHDLAAQVEGLISAMGIETRPSPSLPEDKLLQAKLGNKTIHLRRLSEGDKVKEGEILAIIDNRLASLDHDIRKTRLERSTNDVTAAKLAVQNAEEQFLRIKQLSERGVVSAEEFASAKRGVARATAELESKTNDLRISELELSQAQVRIDSHVIRSPVTGKVTAIYHKRGEGVRALEPVIQIKAD